MARLPRLAVAGLPHLVIQRSAGDRAAFVDEVDRRSYLDALVGAARSCGVAIHAYALTDDAVYLLVTPGRAEAIGQFMQRVGRSYVPAFNRRHARAGALWAGRFGAAVVDPERYVLASIRYVEQAPVRCGAVAEARLWPWSSAGHHLGRQTSPWITEHPAYWRIGNTPFEREARHEKELGEPLGEAQLAEFGHAVQRGWPLGSRQFAAGIELATGRKTRPLPRGRPRTGSRPADAAE